RMRPDAMRKLRRTELEASSESRFQFQFARACHALARVMRCLRLDQEERQRTISITLFPEEAYQSNRDRRRSPKAELARENVVTIRLRAPARDVVPVRPRAAC